ncbi:MAG: hypothetical protein AVO33_10800 [delta proteobacterium ML8_F1]|nr:MAG: hypothetical protein AVO33_10800 [delta proteobacterium ML8_F1]
MLRELTISNFIIIDRINVQFDQGLNIITGETGAGKSIIIEAINLALGKKLKNGGQKIKHNKAVIELVFDVDSSRLSREAHLGIPLNDGLIVITREIYPSGKSLSKLNGEIITQNDLRILTEELIDVHGQYMHQALLDETTHLKIIDQYGGTDLKAVLQEVERTATAHAEILDEINHLEDDGDERALESLQFELRELSRIQLDPRADEELFLKFDRLSHLEELMDHLGQSLEIIDQDPGILEALQRLKRHLAGVERVDSDFTPLIQRIDSTMIEISDIRDELRDKESGYDFDPQTYQQLENRHTALSLLMKKYGMTLPELKAFEEELQEKIRRIEGRDLLLKDLKNRERLLYQEYLEAATVLSDHRKRLFKAFRDRVIGEIEDLNLTGVLFDASFTVKTRGGRHRVDTGGFDDVKFLLSANKGMQPLPLKTVASGGEISRIMLGIKIAMSLQDPIETMVFDEIDTGISGNTAYQVAKKMGALSGLKQLIVITHLPQIAAAAHRHLKIEKLEGLSQLIPLDPVESTNEVARMLSGDKLTEIAIDNARHLIDQMKG